MSSKSSDRGGTGAAARGHGAELRLRSRPARIGTRAGYASLLIGLVALLVVAMTAGISIGAVAVPIAEVWASIIGHISGSRTEVIDTQDRVVWIFRTPRVLLAAVVGAGLALAGAALQATVRNVLADPYLLGVASGASLGAVSVLVLGSGAVAGLGVSAAAFVGALAATLVVLALGQRAGKFFPARLILAGVAIAAVLQALTSYLQLQANPQALGGLVFWLLGTVAGAEWSDLALPAVAVLISSVWLLGLGGRLNVLLSGDDAATSVGVNVNRLRLQVVVVSAILTGTAVAVAGGIGFVGLMLPHVARMLVGPDHRRMLPVAALLGASFLVLVDLLARTVQAPAELPLGIFTAAVGAPFFLWLLTSTRRVSLGS